MKHVLKLRNLWNGYARLLRGEMTQDEKDLLSEFRKFHKEVVQITKDYKDAIKGLDEAVSIVLRSEKKPWYTYRKLVWIIGIALTVAFAVYAIPKLGPCQFNGHVGDYQLSYDKGHCSK